MRIVHDPAGAANVLATDVETAETTLEQARGLMFRSSLSDEYALVFPFEAPAWPLSLCFDAVGWRSVHMVGVRVPLDVVWLVDGEVRQVKTLRPWWGLGLARADTVIELPAGAAAGVAAGDRIEVVTADEGRGAAEEPGS